ncbi:disulfide bond formation protein DsbB [Arsukibacterium sp.]|uniref:disulfide bond formation protein DsbB n=1 Tax=Arsukibacterium sp. TaxID=1977258 RepID=UPI002FDAF05E
MLYWLKSLSAKRSAWLALVLTVLIVEAIALYFQYGMNLQPCIKCIYIRVAFAGILVAGLIGVLAAPLLSIRLLALAGWLAAAGFGIYQAVELVEIEQILASGGFSTCALFANFPSWLPLDKWLPAVFEVTGSCGMVDWQFAGLSMAYWSMLLLIAYFAVAFVLTLAQLAPLNRRHQRR